MALSITHRRRLLALGLLVVGLIVLALVAPLREWALGLEAWLGDAGALGWVVYIVVFTVWNMLLPPLPLQLLAGYVYGVAGGMALMYAGSTLAILCAFWLTRTALRGSVERALAARPVMRAVDQAFADEGWRAVMLLRLSNVLPSNLANIACGASGQRLWTVLWASWLGKFPGILLVALLGSAGRQMLDGEGAGPATWISLTIGIVATVIMTVLMTRRTRALLRAEESDSGDVVTA